MHSACVPGNHDKKQTSIKSIKFTPVANGIKWIDLQMRLVRKWRGYLMLLLRVHALDLINTSIDLAINRIIGNNVIKLPLFR